MLPLVYIVPSVVATGFLLHKFYFAGGVCRYRTDLSGKTAIVTGANTGIGKETVKMLAGMGAHVILACRNIKLANEAIDDIKKEIGNKGKIEAMELDLANLKSVRQFADAFNQRNVPLNLLVNNAGIMALPKRQTTADGFEAQLGVNHLGHFLLTNLLIDKLKAGSPSRIVNVSSEAHTMGSVNFDDLMSEKSYKPWGAYGQSKTANILFTVELQKRFADQGIQSYALHPGVVRTELARNLGLDWLLALATPLTMMIMKTPFEGAQTTLHCAITPDAKGGKYYQDCAEKTPKSYASDEGAAKKLWEISETLVGLKKA